MAARHDMTVNHLYVNATSSIQTYTNLLNIMFPLTKMKFVLTLIMLRSHVAVSGLQTKPELAFTLNNKQHLIQTSTQVYSHMQQNM